MRNQFRNGIVDRERNKTHYMKVLYCVSEVAPIFKLGGLGDVAGSLPKALAGLGVDIRIALPFFSSIDRKRYAVSQKPVDSFRFPYGENHGYESVSLYQTKIPGSHVPVLLFANARYLSQYVSQREYGTTIDTIARFSFFSEAIVFWLLGHKQTSQWFPDIIHLNDWHVSLVAAVPSIPKTLLTIHNLSYQGIDANNSNKKNQPNLLRLGLKSATLVNTVSKTYAKDIQTKEFGENLEGILKQRKKDLTGILNGIDYSVWNPMRDQYLNQELRITNYELRQKKYDRFKTVNKYYLQKSLALPTIADIPVFAFIGRIEPQQKGIDILIHALENLLPKTNFQMVILGTGEPIWEDRLHKISHLKSTRKKFVFADRFDEALAHRIYAGADFILIPSKFEPCGLVQMIAMRYAAIPIVRATGGLADTVKDKKTGLTFKDYSAKELEAAVARALWLYFSGKKFERMRQKGVEEDFSWEKSAKEYVKLYWKIMRL